MNRKICPRCRSTDVQNLGKTLIHSRTPTNMSECRNCRYIGFILTLTK